MTPSTLLPVSNEHLTSLNHFLFPFPNPQLLFSLLFTDSVRENAEDYTHIAHR